MPALPEKITKAATATDRVQTDADRAMTALNRAFTGRVVNGYGVYSDPSRARGALLEARGALNAALDAMAAACWPTEDHYDAADQTSEWTA